MGNTIIESLELIKTDTCPEQFLKFIEEIKSIKYISNVQLYYNVKYKGIFIFACINIELPSYGVIDGLDIRKVEENLFYLSPHYPYKAPYTMMNREDFPFSSLSHVNTFIYDNTDEFIFKPYLCLHRGNVDEWFHEVGVSGYVARVKKWLKDATKGELIKHNDGFEPMMRLDSSFGSIVYDTDSIINFIEQNQKSQIIEFRSMRYNKQNIRKVYVDDNFIPTKNIIPCIIIYDKNSDSKDGYLGEYRGELQDFINFLDYKLIERAISRYNNIHNNGYPSIGLCFLIYGIKRPQKLIGQRTNIELLNFFIALNINSKSAKVVISGKEGCRILNHIKQFSPSVAAEISASEHIIDKKLLFVGCGALGSKISLSLARMGVIKQSLVDNDIILPHNLARNALTFDSFENDNIYKSNAMQMIITAMYKKALCKSYKDKIMDFPIEKLNENDYIIDCTASGIVLDYFVSTSGINTPIIRAEIADEGRLGFTFIENKSENVNIKDLRYVLYYEALKNETIYNWLNKVAKNETDFAHQEFSIGFGCSSDTMIIDDAVINIHAGITTSIIKNLSSDDFGSIYINLYHQNDLTKNSVFKITVEPYKVIKNDDWTIKTNQSVLNKIYSIANDKLENGGIFIGNVDNKDKVVRILDIFIPPDNQRSCLFLVRGQIDIEKHLNYISKRTAGLITYVGEWHTHPNMATQMSKTDENTFTGMAKELAKIQFPALLGIFNGNNETFYLS